ncbi:MAG: AlpA family phage regulatory protein [Proteobacteria bacterium]|nr:AlpA family phage regulatory protein [Pseudomonadota bacterium]
MDAATAHGVVWLVLLRLPEVRKRCGLSRSEIYRRIRNGSFPPPIKLGASASAWSSAEIDSWIADRIAERDSAKAAA